MNDTEEPQGKDIPPYLSPTTFLNFVEAHRRTLPTRIDRSIMGNVAGGDQVKILRALRFFDLINDEGEPTIGFHAIAALQPAEAELAWADLIRHAYPYLFEGFDLQKATQGQIEERFRERGIKGDTVRKAVAFFIGIARAAGLPLSPYFKGTKKRGPSGPRGPRKSPQRRSAVRDEGAAGSDAGGGSERPPSKLPPVIQAWIDDIPPAGEPWLREDFDSWLALFSGSIERLYKIAPKKKDPASNY